MRGMGGRGSGRQQRYARKTTEGYLALDLAFLTCRGLLQPGRSASITWSREEVRMSAVTVRAASASLHLAHHLVAGKGSAVAVDEVVDLQSTETSLGGIRRWLECPACNRRSRVLYGPRFRCRLCHGLSYESQFESRAQRANWRARKIRRRLGGSDCLMDEFPPKPPGMHWRTYRRLEALEAAAETRWSVAIIGLLSLRCDLTGQSGRRHTCSKGPGEAFTGSTSA